MSFSSAAPAPPTPLGLYRALSKNASIHVSPLVLGGMSIGDAWEAVGMWKMNKETVCTRTLGLGLRIKTRFCRVSSYWTRFLKPVETLLIPQTASQC